MCNQVQEKDETLQIFQKLLFRFGPLDLCVDPFGIGLLFPVCYVDLQKQIFFRKIVYLDETKGQGHFYVLNATTKNKEICFRNNSEDAEVKATHKDWSGCEK